MADDTTEPQMISLGAKLKQLASLKPDAPAVT